MNPPKFSLPANEPENLAKFIWMGVGAVFVSIALPAIVLSASLARQESRSLAAIDEVFIRCPLEIENWLRSNYEEGVHEWALALTKEICEDRRRRKFDAKLYKRLVLSALADRAGALGREDTALAMQLAASGVDTSLKANWRDMAEEINPDMEELFTAPTIKRTDEDGEVVFVGKAAPPMPPGLETVAGKHEKERSFEAQAEPAGTRDTDPDTEAPENAMDAEEEKGTLTEVEDEMEPAVDTEPGSDPEMDVDTDEQPAIAAPGADAESEAPFEAEMNEEAESADLVRPESSPEDEESAEAEPEPFVQQEAPVAGLAAGSGGGLVVLSPPVEVRAQPIRGSGESRRAELQVVNNGDLAIAKLVVGITLYNEDGSVQRTVPHTCDGAFGENGKELGEGRDHEIELTDFWIKDDTAAVAGTVKEITWEDGTRWPAWTGPPGEPQGEDPVSLVFKGVLGADSWGWGLPLIEAFNHSDREVRGVSYRVRFLDDEGNEIASKRWGERRYSFGPGEGVAMVGFEGPPEGTEKVELSLEEVSYRDDPGVANHAPLTAEQINGREDVKGGNWTVSFEEECHLGFILAETAKDGTRTLTFHWATEPSKSHAFHYDHHEHKGDHELIFSPVSSGPGDADGGAVTFRFSNPEYGHKQSWQVSDLEFNPAARRMGRGVYGPVSLYSWEASFSRMAYDLKAVFAKDPTAAEQSLEKVLGNR